MPKRSPSKLPRITRLLALAHHLQDLLDRSVVSDYADIARVSGLSRARIMQIMNLMLPVPGIKEDIIINTTGTNLKRAVAKINSIVVARFIGLPDCLINQATTDLPASRFGPKQPLGNSPLKSLLCVWLLRRLFGINGLGNVELAYAKKNKAVFLFCL
jgi:hypothetical protein